MIQRFVLLAALLCGCDGLGYDVDGVLLAPLDQGGTDTRDDDLDTSLPDSAIPDLGADAARDLGGADADIGPDADMPPVFVSNCEIPHPLDPTRCNPTNTGECPEGGFCSLAVASTPPPELLCVQRQSEGTADFGAACERAFDCREGLTCVDWGLQEADPRPKACSRYCEIETNRGCLAGEFCTTATSQPPLEGIGWCTPECDPYDASACPADQTCNVDYNYPAGSCTPKFRCVSVEGSAAEGESCGPGRAVASCAEDLICYEIDIADFRCVAPCQSDAECTSGTCGPPAGAWGLRHCS